MKKQDRADLFNSENVMLAIWNMAVPLMLISVINSLYSLTDTFWVGRIDELQVGAVSLVSPINQCGNAFSTGLAASATALISKRIGSGKKDEANHVATIILELCFVLGLAIAAISIIFAKPILAWLGTPDDIYHNTYMYLIGISLDFMFVFVLNIFSAVRQSNGDPKTGVKVNMAAGIINIVLDPILMFGLHWNLFGAAMATTLSKALVTPFAIHSLMTDKTCTMVDFKKYKFDLKLVKEIVSVSIPSSIGSCLSSLGFALINKDVVKYGSIALSAYGIGSKISNISYIPIYALGSALTPFIGNSIGQNNFEKIKKCYKEAMKLMLMVSIAMIVFGFLTTNFWIHIFISNASDTLVALATESTYYQVFTCFFMGWFSNIQAVFNGAGQTRFTLIFQVGRLWVIRIPLIKLFMTIEGVGITGVWWAMCLSNLIISMIGHGWYKLVFLPQMEKKMQLKAQND